jgi:hypothetical protein
VLGIIRGAEERAAIKPGDTLIEGTSGTHNTQLRNLSHFPCDSTCPLAQDVCPTEQFADQRRTLIPGKNTTLLARHVTSAAFLR